MAVAVAVAVAVCRFSVNNCSCGCGCGCVGSEEARAALQRANRFFTVAPIYDTGDGVSIIIAPVRPLQWLQCVAAFMQL